MYKYIQKLIAMTSTIAQTIAISASQVQLKELHPTFGVEITGLDFADGVTVEGQRIILNAVVKV